MLTSRAGSCSGCIHAFPSMSGGCRAFGTTSARKRRWKKQTGSLVPPLPVSERGTYHMLDLNYVRDNLEAVRAGLAKRGMAPEALDNFARADQERRRTIAESDQLNA